MGWKMNTVSTYTCAALPNSEVSECKSHNAEVTHAQCFLYDVLLCIVASVIYIGIKQYEQPKPS